MELIFSTKKSNRAIIQLKQSGRVIAYKSLTVNQDFDILLITHIDKFLARNKIRKLLLKKPKIRGKLSPNAVSSMIIKTVASALGI